MLSNKSFKQKYFTEAKIAEQNGDGQEGMRLGLHRDLITYL